MTYTISSEQQRQCRVNKIAQFDTVANQYRTTARLVPGLNPYQG